MLHLQRESLVKNRTQWLEQGFKIYQFDEQAVMAATKETPQWLHIGSGNIFRAFIAPAQQQLLEQGDAQTGIIATTTHNLAVIDKVYRPYDNLSVAVTMHTNGQFDKEVIGSIVESVACSRTRTADWQRLTDIFTNPSLQIVSFTITEKGYKLTDYAGNYYDDVAADLANGPAQTTSSMGNVAALVYARFTAGAAPFAFLSLDNCSHNGDVVQNVMTTFAKAWVAKGLAEPAFVDYVTDTIAYPFSMIDKIVPTPSPKVQDYLKSCDFADTDLIQAGSSEYAVFVNAEKAQYLVVEDSFPNGRPPLEKTGVIFTDRETVNKAERMKVGTCLNPLHTALAVYGCLLGYTLIADEMKDVDLKKLVEHIGYDEGLPVVVNPGVLNPKEFIRQLLEERLPNPNVPDAPQRIATDTSQKVGVRYGDTIKAYGDQAKTLRFIPLAIAGWCRYLLGIDDKGQKFQLSSDPLMDNLQQDLQGVVFGKPETAAGALRPILSNAAIFGSDLYAAGVAPTVEAYFKELIAGPGAVRATLEKYV